MKRVAAIDCGTNSIRLLIADVSHRPNGEVLLTDVTREMRIVRLGQGVDHTGELATQAIERTLQAVTEYKRLIDEYQAEAVRFVGTSAMRDARNGAEVIESVRRVLGVSPEIIPGTEEAFLSFWGASSALPGPRALPSLVVDIGGGSTEFVLGNASVEQSISINMGSVRVTERFRLHPGDRNAEAQASAWIDEQLDHAEKSIDFARVGSLIGVAGTVTTVAAEALGVATYSPDITHGKFLPWTVWDKSIRFMMDESIETKAALGFMPQGRADVIGAGALIWSRILHRLQCSTANNESPLTGAYVSEHDILDGIALSIAADDC